MLGILLVSAAPASLAQFAAVLKSQEGAKLDWAKSAAEAIDKAKQDQPDLVILDEHIRDLPVKELIQQLLSSNFMINTAVVSSLPSGEFHEEFEGLGVLGQLPPSPGKSHALDIFERLRKLKDQFSGLESSVTNKK